MTLKKISSLPALSATHCRLAIVCAEYHPEFTGPLLAAAEQELLDSGVKQKNIFIVRVPGSYEIPVVTAKLARSRKYDAIIALGVVLQGKTDHAQQILQATSIHLQQIAVETGVPVINEVLSPANASDARQRTSGNDFNRGKEAARTAIRMALISKKLGKFL